MIQLAENWEDFGVKEYVVAFFVLLLTLWALPFAFILVEYDLMTPTPYD